LRISVTYFAKWRLKGYENYQWTSCKKLINVMTGREIKKTLHGLTPGYWIGRKFIKLSEMSSMVELIPKDDLLPF